jgi:hypothetical protein
MTDTNALKSLLRSIDDDLATQRKAAADARALPAGKRGRRAAALRADALVEAALTHRRHVVDALNDAAAPAVFAWAKGHLHGVIDDVLIQVLNAARQSRRCIALRTEVGDVYANVQFNDLGFPTYVEIRQLADRDHVVASATKWRDEAKTAEEKARAEAILAEPDTFPMYASGSVGSITVGPSHRWNDETGVVQYYANASTWQAYNDDDADLALRLVQVARLVRLKLNALDLPTDHAIQARLAAAVAA